MSGLYENLPFSRGATYGAADNTLAVHLEGREYILEDDQFGTGLYVKVRVCRNNSGIALQGKRAVKFNLTAGKGLVDVAGYATVLAEVSGISDDKLPPTGVPNGDLFYVVTAGPVLAKGSLTGDVIAVGDPLHALSGTTTGATTAGRVGPAVFTGLTTVGAGQINNVVGYAMSAKTAGNTNADLLLNATDGRF